LWTIFLRFGSVGEVRVPLKCDPRGRRFRFVRYKDVRDVEALEQRLGEVWLGGSRLKINKAKFDREERAVAAVPVRKELAVGSGKVVSKDHSFKNVVQQGLSGGVMPVVMRRLVLLPSEDRLEELKHCFVGVLSFQREANQVLNSLLMGGFNQIGVTPLGANMVLLKAADPLSIVEAERRQDPWWRGLFISVKKWSPNVVAKQRKVWLKVYGLPLHVWEEKCFKTVGSMFGDFVDFDESTIGFTRLDLARICVNTTRMAFINEKLRLDVMGALYDVWVVEEGGVQQGPSKEEVNRWEEGSMASSNGGREGVGRPELLVDGDATSHRECQSVHLATREGLEEDSHHLMLRRQVGRSEEGSQVGHHLADVLGKIVSNDPIREECNSQIFASFILLYVYL
jgi:hypothetical protein